MQIQEKVVKFSMLKEGQKFLRKRNNTIYTKKLDIVSNTVSDNGVALRLNSNEEVTLFEKVGKIADKIPEVEKPAFYVIQNLNGKFLSFDEDSGGILAPFPHFAQFKFCHHFSSKVEAQEYDTGKDFKILKVSFVFEEV